MGKNTSNYWEMFNSDKGYFGIYKGGLASDKSEGVQFVINPNGNVAIGAAGWSGIAKEKLHVHGNVQIDGRLLVRELNLIAASWKTQTNIQYVKPPKHGFVMKTLFNMLGPLTMVSS